MKEQTNKLSLFIIIGLILGIITKLFIIDVLKISGTSMEPSIKNNSFVVVNKLSYGLVIPFSSSFFLQWNTPKQNEVVIYLHNNKIVIKRCIAISNDQLDFLQDSQYYLIVNNNKIKLTSEQYNKLKNFNKVPEGYVLAIGDNHKTSIDSRDYGFISEKNIIGRVFINE